MANLIKNRPGLVNDQEACRIVQILKDAIGPRRVQSSRARPLVAIQSQDSDDQSA